MLDNPFSLDALRLAYTLFSFCSIHTDCGPKSEPFELKCREYSTKTAGHWEQLVHKLDAKQCLSVDFVFNPQN